jgi:3-oxoacyl-[acyl-carrier protein] reductase
MQKELEGKIALVTGSSRGIGKAIALVLAREGADVVLCASSQDELNSAKTEVETFGGTVYARAYDARSESDVAALFTEVVAPLGRLDILVNNVGGVHDHATFEDLDVVKWRDAWELNFLTAVIATRTALPWLRKSSSARIVNIASSAAKQPGGFNPHYGSAKTALVGLSKALANTYASENILVNTVCPTTVNGGMWDAHIKDKSERMKVSVEEATKLMEKEVIGKTPLGKMVTPTDVAELVAFLASDRAKSITGICIQVDGGMIKSIF